MSKVVPLEGFGGGSSPLNFKIVAYATEEELIAAQPRKNTIGIVTTTPITGYRFSATEPEGMIDGKVWISTGTNSNSAFDIVNDVTIYPISAKQYVSGAWADVIAKSYQNGAWVDWSVTLYPPGSDWNTATSGNGHATINGDGIILREQWISYSQYQQATTKSKWDVTGFNKLRARMKTSSTGCTKVVALSAVDSSNVRDGSFAAKVQNATQKPETIFECDISGLSGEYYVVVGQYIGSGNSNNYTIFDKVWME